MAVGMSFLNSGKINENWSVFCSGAIELGGRKFRCWKGWGHGRVSLEIAEKLGYANTSKFSAAFKKQYKKLFFS